MPGEGVQSSIQSGGTNEACHSLSSWICGCTWIRDTLPIVGEWERFRLGDSLCDSPSGDSLPTGTWNVFPRACLRCPLHVSKGPFVRMFLRWGQSWEGSRCMSILTQNIAEIETDTLMAMATAPRWARSSPLLIFLPAPTTKDKTI